MRTLYIFLCLFLNLHAKNIEILQENNTLTLKVPTTLAFQEEKNLFSYTLILEEALEPFTQTLQDPFKQIQIQTQDKQTRITLSASTQNLTFKQMQEGSKRVLIFQAHNSIAMDWLRYGGVILILLGLIGFLLYVKRKIPQKRSKHFISSQIPLDSRSKIILIESQEKIYLVLCNERGNVLLDSCSKDNPPKDFSTILHQT